MIPNISSTALKARLDAGETVSLLDVRENHERAFCSISASDLHVPMGAIPSRLDEVAALTAPIVVYCHHGVRSMAAARWLAARGVQGLFNLDGGIDAWSTDVDPRVPRY